MRRDFWKGIIAGGIIGALVKMVAGRRNKLQKKESFFAEEVNKRTGK